jgi:hypothetical protein
MERGLKVGMIGRMLESRKAYRAFQIWKEVVYDIQEGERGLERRIECASRLVRKKVGWRLGWLSRNLNIHHLFRLRNGRIKTRIL